jgi:pilus assembly protein CpaE
MLTAAVAASTAESSGTLRACLQQTGLVHFVTEWTMSAQLSPGPGESVPDVVILELGRDPEPCLQFAAHVRRLRPSVCIIVCSPPDRAQPDLLMQAMRSGVREFLPQPLDAQALQVTLERFTKERGGSESENVEKLWAVVGAKGGVGTTTVAVNLGVQIRKLTQKRVVLMDIARPLGQVSLMLDLRPRFTLVDAVENLKRLDTHFFNGLLTNHASGLEVLAGPADPDLWLRIPVASLARLVNVAQSTCDYLLMDLGTLYNSEWAETLRFARGLILVAEADVPSLWALERHLATFSSMGLARERFRLVINRYHRNDEDALKALEKKIKHTIFARLPNDFRQVSEAVNLGAPLSRNHNDALVVKFKNLAAQCTGVAPAADTKRSNLFSLFSSS